MFQVRDTQPVCKRHILNVLHGEAGADGSRPGTESKKEVSCISEDGSLGGDCSGWPWWEQVLILTC